MMSIFRFQWNYIVQFLGIKERKNNYKYFSILHGNVMTRVGEFSCFRHCISLSLVYEANLKLDPLLRNFNREVHWRFCIICHPVLIVILKYGIRNVRMSWLWPILWFSFLSSTTSKTNWKFKLFSLACSALTTGLISRKFFSHDEVYFRHVMSIFAFHWKEGFWLAINIWNAILDIFSFIVCLLNTSDFFLNGHSCVIVYK